MKPYSEVRKEAADRMAQPHGDGLMPCRYCGDQTSISMLSLFGARCQRCVRQFEKLGYSGDRPPPPKHEQSTLVKASRDQFLSAAQQPAEQPSAFAVVAQKISAAQTARQVPKGLSDDEVNDLIDGVLQ